MLLLAGGGSYYVEKLDSVSGRRWNVVVSAKQRVNSLMEHGDREFGVKICCLPKYVRKETSRFARGYSVN
jgi:hypothetical protein